MSRMGNFVCTECGAANVAPHNQFSEALEYRRLDSQERLHRRTLRLLCRKCVEDVKSGTSAHGDQGALL